MIYYINRGTGKCLMKTRTVPFLSRCPPAPSTKIPWYMHYCLLIPRNSWDLEGSVWGVLRSRNTLSVLRKFLFMELISWFHDSPRYQTLNLLFKAILIFFYIIQKINIIKVTLIITSIIFWGTHWEVLILKRIVSKRVKFMLFMSSNAKSMFTFKFGRFGRTCIKIQLLLNVFSVIRQTSWSKS